jgi:phosphatidylinositol alpha-mannosyltransferase
MKIGFVSQAYYPRYGGVSENVAHSAAVLAERGHDVTVITGRPLGVGHPPAEAVPGLPGLDRVRVRRFGYGLMIPFQGAFVDVVLGPSLRDDLERFWQREHFDVVHIHQPLTPTLPLLTTLLRPSLLVGTFHAAGTRSRLWEAFRSDFNWHFDRIDLSLAVSPSAASFMTQVYGETPLLLPNGVDTRRFHLGVEPIPGARDGRFTVLFVGRLDPRKGLGVLLKAWGQVVRELSGEARLNIVGSSALAPWLRSRVPSKLRSTITFAGAVPASDLPGWYAAADVFCSPAVKNESFGVVLLEAMASGLPVVCSDLPGYRAVCRPKVEGLLARAGDANALAAALTALARDSRLSRHLSQAGRTRAETFDWSRVGRELEGLYTSLLAGGPVRVATAFADLDPIPATDRIPATSS